MNFLTGPIKTENLFHERHWDGREFEHILPPRVGAYEETPEEYLCRRPRMS